jgi:hypothetical protein
VPRSLNRIFVRLCEAGHPQPVIKLPFGGRSGFPCGRAKLATMRAPSRYGNSRHGVSPRTRQAPIVAEQSQSNTGLRPQAPGGSLIGSLRSWRFALGASFFAAQLAERHRRASRVLGVHSITSAARTRTEGGMAMCSLSNWSTNAGIRSGAKLANSRSSTSERGST